MRTFSPVDVVVLGCLAALGSGGCLLFTSLSGFDEPPPTAPADDAATDAEAAAPPDARDAGTVEIVAHDAPGITSIAVHADGLYYARPEARALYRVASTDFGPNARGAALITDKGALREVAVSALDVFVTTGGGTSDACILRAKHDGSGVATIQDYCTVKFRLVASPSTIFALGTDSSEVNGLWRIDVATGSATRIFSGLTINSGQIISGVAYDGANIYVSEQVSSKITTLTSTSTLADFVSEQAVVDMTADPTTLYWLTQDGSVRSLPTSGVGQPRELAKLVAPQRIAIDETSLYVTTSGLTASSGALVRIAKGGGPPKELATGLANPSALVVHGSHVYWANLDDGTIMRVARE